MWPLGCMQPMVQFGLMCVLVIKFLDCCEAKIKTQLIQWSSVDMHFGLSLLIKNAVISGKWVNIAFD